MQLCPAKRGIYQLLHSQNVDQFLCSLMDTVDLHAAGWGGGVVWGGGRHGLSGQHSMCYHGVL